MGIITRKVNFQFFKKCSIIVIATAALLLFTYGTPKNQDGYLERIYIVENKTNTNIDNAKLYNTVIDTAMSFIDTNNSDNFNEDEYSANHYDYDVENKAMDEMIDDYESNEKFSLVQSIIESESKTNTKERNESSSIFSLSVSDIITNKDTEEPFSKKINTEKPSILSKGSENSPTEKNSDQELDDVWIKKMEDRFERRRSRLKDGCKKLNSKLNYSTEITLKEHIYMATKYDLLVCSVAKAGASTWKAHLLTMNGYNSSGNVHTPQNENKTNAGLIISLDAVYKRMQDTSYTRVMNARHPLDRLVSAYRDKYNGGGVISDCVFKRIAAKHLNKSDKDFERISFEDFLRIVIRDQWAGLENEHWGNYYRICSPCQLNYDYVMKVETHNEDLEYIFRKIGETEINPEVRRNGRREISDRDKYEKYYKDIPNDLIRKIHQLYKEDYELFGYDVPEFVIRSLQ